jgi:hypothetical protein
MAGRALPPSAKEWGYTGRGGAEEEAKYNKWANSWRRVMGANGVAEYRYFGDDSSTNRASISRDPLSDTQMGGAYEYQPPKRSGPTAADLAAIAESNRAWDHKKKVASIHDQAKALERQNIMDARRDREYTDMATRLARMLMNFEGRGRNVGGSGRGTRSFGGGMPIGGGMNQLYGYGGGGGLPEPIAPPSWDPMPDIEVPTVEPFQGGLALRQHRQTGKALQERLRWAMDNPQQYRRANELMGGGLIQFLLQQGSGQGPRGPVGRGSVTRHLQSFGGR